MSVSLSKLTVSELKRQLVAAGLKVSGRKADLVQRLLDASEKIQKKIRGEGTEGEKFRRKEGARRKML